MQLNDACRRDVAVRQITLTTYCFCFQSILTLSSMPVNSLNRIIDAARILCGRVCVTVRCPSVRSVRPVRSLQQRVAGLLLWARWAGNIDHS